jgi:hypothetical protein
VKRLSPRSPPEALNQVQCARRQQVREQPAAGGEQRHRQQDDLVRHATQAG